MSSQTIYFYNPSTLNNVNQNVNGIYNSTVVRGNLSTGACDNIKAFYTGTLGLYTDVKMIGGVVGQVNPKDEFSFYHGWASPVLTTTGSSNLIGVSITGGFVDNAVMINPRNAFNETLASSGAILFSEDSIFTSTSTGKPYWSIVLGTLVDRGVLRLNDPVIQYFPNWRYMTVFQQRWYTNGTGVYNATGLNGSIDTFLYATGAVTDDLVVTLTDGRVGPIAAFMSGPTGGAASTTGAGYDALKSRIIKIDTNALPAWKQPFASNTGALGVYYCEVKPIDVLATKTYGTVAMCFSHQMGLGFNVPKTKNILSYIRDAGAIVPYMGSTTLQAGKTTPTLSILDQYYTSYNPYYPYSTGGYSHVSWANEIIQAGLLSTMPGEVWEYDASPCLGMACCEIAYQRFYKLPYVKPIWQIAQELVNIPLGITKDIMLKRCLAGTGTLQAEDQAALRTIRDKYVAQYAGTSTFIWSPTLFSTSPTSTSSSWAMTLGTHDLGFMNNVWFNLRAMKKLAFMVANYGLAENGVRILSKKFVQAMCEANYLSPDCNYYSYDERPTEANANRSTDSQLAGAYENVGFGLGGLVFKPRVGKELDMCLDNPDGWYKWSGAWGSVFWLKPSEGKYIVSMHKNNSSSNPDLSTDTGPFIVENYYAGTKQPPSYGNYGFDVKASAYTY